MSTIGVSSNTERADRHLPITYGRLLDFTDDPVACMQRLQAAHGNLAALEEDSQRIVFVFGPEWNQHVLSDAKTFHSRFFAIRGPRNSAQRRLTSGLMTINGDDHKQHRRVVMGPFQKKVIPSHHGPICRLTEELLDNWQPGQVRDMHEEMTQFMLRVTSALLFGLDRPEFAYRLGGMIDRWVDMNHKTGMGAFIADAQITDLYSRLLTLAEELEADIRAMIHLRRNEGRRGDDVLSLLVEANEQLGIVGDDQLIGHVALLFGAAHLTTAHTLTWTLFLLAQHPTIMRAVHEEMTTIVQGAAPTLEEIERMPLTERVVKESMRILPASSYSQRINPEPAQLGPLHLPRGTPIVFSQYITHHMPEHYPEPDVFRPDRWLEISPSPYAYLPFGTGPRMCLGGPLAMMTLKTALPTILNRYRLSVVPGSEISGRVISTMLGPVTSVPMLVSNQDGQFSSSPVTGNIHDMVRLVEAPAADTRKAA